MNKISLITICVLMAGCASDPERGPATTTTVTTPAPGCIAAAIPADQWFVPCPSSLSVFLPELVMKSGSQAFRGQYDPVLGYIVFTGLPPGNYTTQDGRYCDYTVTAEGNIE